MGTIIRRVDRGVRRLATTTQVAITELLWDDGGHSFQVHLADGTDLTADGCFDEAPTDQQLLRLLHTRPGYWSCPSCHCGIAERHADLITDHVRDCVLGNSAGRPTVPGGRA